MENEDDGIADYLRSLPVMGGFKAPEGYLETLVERMDFEEVELEFGEGGFEVPNGYFDNLEGRVMAGVGGFKEAKQVSIFVRQRFWLSAVAASLFMAGFVFLWNQEKALVRTEKSKLEIGQVAAALSVGDLNADLLCDAGWCEELEGLPMVKEGVYDDYLGDVEAEILIEEL
jgi:hypothetical protein